MIRVIKPKRAPAVLRTRGAAAAQKLRDEYEQSPADYQSGGRAFVINRAVYAHPSVVRALRRAQHNKCCFCERKTEGDVEHFRPKGGRQQSAASALVRPGYYWLAYAWENLFFACGPCNQRHKRNLFPLRRPTRQALSHHDDVTAEEPLLIDPGADDPREHIGFRGEVAYPVKGSRRGRETIRVLRLNREDLVESRRDRLWPLKALKAQRERILSVIDRFNGNGQPVPRDLRTQLARIRRGLRAAVSDDAEYASMARDLLP